MEGGFCKDLKEDGWAAVRKEFLGTGCYGRNDLEKFIKDEDVYHCDQCPREFKDAYSLVQHIVGFARYFTYTFYLNISNSRMKRHHIEINLLSI